MNRLKSTHNNTIFRRTCPHTGQLRVVVHRPMASALMWLADDMLREKPGQWSIHFEGAERTVLGCRRFALGLYHITFAPCSDYQVAA